MSRDFFVKAVARALEADMRVYEGPRRHIVIVPSASRPGLFYATSRSWCTCPAHYFTGRCKHRALAIAWIDLLGEEPIPRERREREIREQETADRGFLRKAG